MALAARTVVSGGGPLELAPPAVEWVDLARPLAPCRVCTEIRVEHLPTFKAVFAPLCGHSTERVGPAGGVEWYESPVAPA